MPSADIRDHRRRIPSRGGGVRALWNPGRIPHSPFSQSSAQTSESISVSVQICRLGAGWGLLSQERLSAPRQVTGPRPPGRPGPWAWVPPPRARPTWPGTVAGPCSRPQVPGSSLALCLWRGGRRAGKWGPREKDRTSGWRGELPGPRTRPQGPCEAGLICPGWGPLPRGRLLVGLPALSLQGPASWPETASRGSEKSHLLGASPLSFAVGRSGRRGLRVSSHLAQ